VIAKRKKILLFFDGSHLAYSPTVTQVYDALSDNFEVTILAEDPRNVTNQRLSNRSVVYYRYATGGIRYLYILLFKFLSVFNKDVKALRENKFDASILSEFLLLKRLLKKNRYERVIAVDIKNLFFCSLLKQRTDFLSLELCKDEQLLSYVDRQLIGCLLIQRPDRKAYLFKEQDMHVFYVQNAPVFRNLPLKKERKGLIFSGTAWDAFGFYHCLAYINKYKEETLTVQGVLLPQDKERIDREYAHLVNESRLLINEHYFENEEVEEYISGYEIGFCFYNFSISWINNYNYKTAPSGKLFKYLAAGVPVVGIDIAGFDFVKEFQCGILIKDLGEAAIREAVQNIRGNYAFFVENALKAAKHFSFDKAITPYVDYIKEVSA
jgi:glycosyltransferase involved in cell wall biosynthesis